MIHKIKGKNAYIHKEISYKKIPELPAGIYMLHDCGGPGEFIPYYDGDVYSNNTNQLIKFKSGVFHTVTTKIDEFLSDKSRALYKDMGFNHCRGYILYGKPGTGKTCLSLLIMQEMVEKYNAICIIATQTHPDIVHSAIGMLRKKHDNPVVMFVDECEDLFKRHENNMLSFLDGINSFDNFLFLGCTNFLERIPDRIKNRKSRIKECIEIASLPEQIYRDYVAKVYSSAEKDFVSALVWQSMEKGVNIDQLKNAIIDIRFDGDSIETAIANAMQNIPS